MNMNKNGVLDDAVEFTIQEDRNITIIVVRARLGHQ
jgi:hypothetical protein